MYQPEVVPDVDGLLLAPVLGVLESVVVLLPHQDILEAVPHLARLELDGLG